jgi:hypothetical protein
LRRLVLDADIALHVVADRGVQHGRVTDVSGEIEAGLIGGFLQGLLLVSADDTVVMLTDQIGQAVERAPTSTPRRSHMSHTESDGDSPSPSLSATVNPRRARRSR